MKLFLLFLSVVIIQCNSYAQNEQWLVKAGESVKEALGDSIIYNYPQFNQGTVYFKDGRFSNASLNLNIFNGEMQFINTSNDTMALSDEGTIKYITIQNDTFYYSKVYVQLMHQNPIAKLGKIETIRSVGSQKTGGYDQSSPASSINSASYFYNANSGTVSKLSEAKEIVLRKETFYFIGDKFGNFQPALKKNIFDMFNSKKDSIDTFIKDNKLQLNKEADLLKLVDFIGEVQN